MELNDLKNIFMKRISIYKIFALLIAATVFLVTCTKETANVKLDPKLTTSQILFLKSDSATVVGFVVSAGSGFSEKGICYDTVTGPTTAKNKVAYAGDNTTASFRVTLSGLAYATKYYARAYAINTSGTVYGVELTFTTLPVVPTLTTTAITAITGNSAAGGGNVTVGGGAAVTARGICFGLNHNPTVADGKTSDGNNTGAFVSALTGLKGNKPYYVRAYATNAAGTGYGPEITFTTLVDLPVAITRTITNIAKTSAATGDSVAYDGGGTITERGIVWGTSANPTTGDHKISNGTGFGLTVDTISGLTLFTSYHARAYAINSAGTAYGADISFTTLADITQFWVVGDYNGWTNSDAAKYIISTATNGGAAEGYVYLTTGGIKLTTDHSWDNAHTFGDNGSGALTNPGNNISVSTAGYYLIKANLGTMTYSITLTNWGVIGDATPGGWNDETALTYDASSGTWIGEMHLTAANIKFRANHDWGYNYGSTAANSTLDAGGSNIAIGLEADYAFTLDLSHPNAYTYMANRWGVIGDATADGWNSDQNMTWDATNKVFTATLDLVVGAIKFRANDAWDLNYGGVLTALTAGGANIAIATAGNYTITFDPWGLKATVTQNKKK
jgi:starch-binding outer membrane protein SusE/F